MSEEWDWKLRLFVSADLVGSTAYKASQHRSKTPDWAPKFKAFFRDFPRYVNNQYQDIQNSKLNWPIPDQILLPWKFSGDEILFHVTLNDYRESLVHLTALKKAIRHFPEEWQHKESPLKLKGSAWLAGFPVTNTEINLQGSEGDQVIDFIGPSVDLGFRISRFATERKFVLSADLALMLLDAAHKLEETQNEYRLHFSDWEKLKGVIDGRNYPIIWIDVRNGEQDLQTLADELRGNQSLNDHSKLTTFLRRFIDEEQKLARPFICGDPDDTYGSVPIELEELREKMMAEESLRGYETETSSDDPNTQPKKTIPDPKSPPSPKDFE